MRAAAAVANLPEDALGMAAAIRKGEITAEDVIERTLATIRRLEPGLACFTAILDEQARRDAKRIDASRASSGGAPPLAGVPFAVKNLFDVEGITTVAGSAIRRKKPPAVRDATAVARLRGAGAILIGALNMDEFAYGFSTENAHFGATHNPHAPERIAGGSSGGSAAAVAARMVPIALGSDTNGSIRVPAALCGVFGLKPTFGRLSRAGAFPFVSSLDHVGPIAATVADLAAVYDLLQGADVADPACTKRAPQFVSSLLSRGAGGLRVGVLAGWFRDGASREALAAVDRVAAALNADDAVELPETARARAAAFCITASEGGALHLPALREQAAAYDPATRDRLLAGALVPASVIVQAQRFRRWYQQQVRAVFERFDLLLAPTTPTVAPRIGQATIPVNGVEVAVRPNLGLYTQPLSFVGLPVLSAPVATSGLPLGVQIVAAPWREDLILRAAHGLEQEGVLVSHKPDMINAYRQ